jgi:hypothetical protein
MHCEIMISLILLNLLNFVCYTCCRSVVMVPDPRLDKSFQDAADQVLNSLLDFNPSEWSLPPFEDDGN